MNSIEQMDINIKEITNSLKSLKQLEVTEPFYHDIGYAKYVNVKDSSNNSFSVIIFQIHDYDEIHPNKFLHKWRQLSSYQLKQKAANLKLFNHENIAKCFDSFEIKSHYYIQIERVESTLLGWINQHHKDNRSSLQKNMFINCALQMLESIQHLHKQKGILHHERLLECFMIDSKNQIKLFHFDFPEKVELSMYKKIFLFQVENNEQFYYHPTLLDLNDREYIYNYNKADIWSLAICFLQLNGISYLNILEFIQKRQISVLPLETLGYDLISIIIHMLQSNEDVFLPSISCLIQQFKKAQTRQLKLPKQILFQALTNNSTSKSLGNIQKVKSYKNKINKYKQNNIDQLKIYMINLTSAIDSAIKEDLSAAYDLFKQSQKDYPFNDFVYLFLGQIDKQNAMKHFDQALKLNHQNCVGYFLKAYNEDNFQKKIDYFEKAIEIDCNNDIYEQSLGQLYYENEDFNKSIKHYQNALSINECNYQVLVNLGNNTLALKQYSQSESYYLQANQIYPNKFDINLALGFIYQNYQDYEIALQFYEKQIAIKPEPYTYYQAGAIYANDKKYQKAIYFSKKAIELMIDNNFYNTIGYCYIELEQYEKVLLLSQKNRTEQKDNLPIYQSESYKSQI